MSTIIYTITLQVLQLSVTCLIMFFIRKHLIKVTTIILLYNVFSIQCEPPIFSSYLPPNQDLKPRPQNLNTNPIENSISFTTNNPLSFSGPTLTNTLGAPLNTYNVPENGQNFGQLSNKRPVEGSPSAFTQAKLNSPSSGYFYQPPNAPFSEAQRNFENFGFPNSDSNINRLSSSTFSPINENTFQNTPFRDEGIGTQAAFDRNFSPNGQAFNTPSNLTLSTPFADTNNRFSDKSASTPGKIYESSGFDNPSNRNNLNGRPNLPNLSSVGDNNLSSYSPPSEGKTTQSLRPNNVRPVALYGPPSNPQSNNPPFDAFRPATNFNSPPENQYSSNRYEGNTNSGSSATSNTYNSFPGSKSPTYGLPLPSNNRNSFSNSQNNDNSQLFPGNKPSESPSSQNNLNKNPSNKYQSGSIPSTVYGAPNNLNNPLSYPENFGNTPSSFNPFSGNTSPTYGPPSPSNVRNSFTNSQNNDNSQPFSGNNPSNGPSSPNNSNKKPLRNSPGTVYGAPSNNLNNYPENSENTPSSLNSFSRDTPPTYGPPSPSNRNSFPNSQYNDNSQPFPGNNLSRDPSSSNNLNKTPSNKFQSGNSPGTLYGAPSNNLNNLSNYAEDLNRVPSNSFNSVTRPSSLTTYNSPNSPNFLYSTSQDRNPQQTAITLPTYSPSNSPNSDRNPQKISPNFLAPTDDTPGQNLASQNSFNNQFDTYPSLTTSEVGSSNAPMYEFPASEIFTPPRPSPSQGITQTYSTPNSTPRLPTSNTPSSTYGTPTPSSGFDNQYNGLKLNSPSEKLSDFQNDFSSKNPSIPSSYLPPSYSNSYPTSPNIGIDPSTSYKLPDNEKSSTQYGPPSKNPNRNVGSDLITGASTSPFGPYHDESSFSSETNPDKLNYPGFSATGTVSRQPAKYEFNYNVKDKNTEFSHQEIRNGNSTQGSYDVVLPDGRKQVVDYEANQEGFHPKIRYEETNNPNSVQGNTPKGSDFTSTQQGYNYPGNQESSFNPSASGNQGTPNKPEYQNNQFSTTNSNEKEPTFTTSSGYDQTFQGNPSSQDSYNPNFSQTNAGDFSSSNSPYPSSQNYDLSNSPDYSSGSPEGYSLGPNRDLKGGKQLPFFT